MVILAAASAKPTPALPCMLRRAYACSSLLAGLGQILDERLELCLRQARERRHDVLLVAGLDVGVRIDDRGADELGEGLLGLLRPLRQFVEVGADLPGRARRGERVARAARLVLEDRRARDGCVRRAGCGRLALQPLVE